MLAVIEQCWSDREVVVRRLCRLRLRHRRRYRLSLRACVVEFAPSVLRKPFLPRLRDARRRRRFKMPVHWRVRSVSSVISFLRSWIVFLVLSIWRLNVLLVHRFSGKWRWLKKKEFLSCKARLERYRKSEDLQKETCSWELNYPPITYYCTVPPILDHSCLVGKLTSSKIGDTKVSGF